MKVEIEKEEKGFKPFKLTLTVESEDELKYLWHLFYSSVRDICSISNEEQVNFPLEEKLNNCDYDVFDILDEEAKKQLKK